MEVRPGQQEEERVPSGYSVNEARPLLSLVKSKKEKPKAPTKSPPESPNLPQDPKKGKKTAYYESIKITNPEEIDPDELLKAMRERFRRKSKKWELLAVFYARCSFSMTFLILFLQVCQMVVLPMKNVVIADKYFTFIQTGLTAASALIAGMQLKLKMNEKAEKLKKGVRIYNRLLRSSAYYLMMTESGGKTAHSDTVAFWKTSLEKEIEDIPVVRTMASL